MTPEQGLICKGSFALGSACGRCSKCVEELKGALAEVLMDIASRPDIQRLMGFKERNTYEMARRIVNGVRTNAN